MKYLDFITENTDIIFRDDLILLSLNKQKECKRCKAIKSNDDFHDLSISVKDIICKSCRNVEACKMYAKNYNEYRKWSDKKIIARRRNLGYAPLNVHFIGSQGHHIDIEHVIYIPKKLHESIPHCVFTGYNMDKINVLAFDYMNSSVL